MSEVDKGMADKLEKTIPVQDGGSEAWTRYARMAPEEEQGVEAVLPSLRPANFAEYVGQEPIKENLQIACNAASKRGEALDHLLFHGPPGLGKTSLARIIARELGVGFKATSGPILERPGDLAAILTALSRRDILFIDEIHRLPRPV